MFESLRATSRDEPLLTGYSGRQFIVLSVGLMAVQMGRQVLPNLLPAIIETLAITPSAAGFGLTVMFGIHALLQYPGGRLSDVLSRKTVLVVALGMAVLGLSVLSVTVTYSMFLLGVAITGVGSGLFYTPMRASLADLFVERRGQAFGINQAAGSAGSVFAAGLAVATLAVAAWRAAFFPIVVALVFILLSVHVVRREPYVLSQINLDLRGAGARLFLDSNSRWLLVAYSIFTFVFMGVSSFLPTFLGATKGFSPALASSGFALLAVVGMVVMPIAGELSDRLTRTRVATSALLVGALGLAGMVAAESIVSVMITVMAFGIGLSAYPPVMQAYLMDTFSDASMGADFGAIKTVYTAVGSLGPVYIGVVAQELNYSVAYGGLVVGLVVGAGIIEWRVRTR